MKSSRIALVCALASIVFAVQASDLDAGKAKAAQVCAACHMADGNSKDPQYPVLAGQFPDYLQKALRDYRSGARSNPVMNAMAKTLTDADIENLAAWFASQPSPLNQDK